MWNMNNKGFIKINRDKLLSWELYQDIYIRSIFLHILTRARYSDGQVNKIKLKKGQLIASASTLAKENGISARQVYRVLKVLEDSDYITVKSTNKYSIITVHNYDEWTGFDMTDSHIKKGFDMTDSHTKRGFDMTDSHSKRGFDMTDSHTNKNIIKEIKEEKKNSSTTNDPKRSLLLPSFKELSSHIGDDFIAGDFLEYLRGRNVKNWKSEYKKWRKQYDK